VARIVRKAARIVRRSEKKAAAAVRNLQQAIAANRMLPWHAELHPRDRFGKFRDSFRLPPAVQRGIDNALARFQHKTFKSQKEANDFTDGIGRSARYTPEQRKVLADFETPAGNDAIQRALREDADLQTKMWIPEGTDKPVPVPSREIHTMEAMVRPTDQDMLLTRTMDYDAFGLTPQTADQLEEWTGRLVRDKGFQPTKIGNPIDPAELQRHGKAGPHVTLSIAAPAGTRAIFGESGVGNVHLDKDQNLRIIRVEQHPGGHYVYAVATPSHMRGKGEAPRALGKKLGPREITPGVEATPEEFRRRGLNPDGTPISSPIPPAGTPAPGEVGLGPTTPLEAGPPVKAVRPAKAIKKAGEEVPFGAGRVTREGDQGPERPRLSREARDLEAAQREGRNRGRGQVSTPEEVQRTADERRAARQAEMEARRLERQARLEELKIRREDARERRRLQRQLEKQTDQTIIRQDAEIAELRRRLERPLLPEGVTEGGTNVRAMSPAQRDDIVRRDAKLRAANPDYPHEDNFDEMRISRAAREIRGMSETERTAPSTATPVREAAPAAAPQVAVGPQEGYVVKQVTPQGTTRTGRVVSVTEDGVTVDWRDGSRTPDMDPEDPDLSFTKPRSRRRPKITRAAAPAAERFPEREGAVKPRAGYGIFWTDENGDLVRGKVVKRNRNGTLSVDWDDTGRENGIDPNDPKYGFENAKEIRQREAAAAREVKKAEKTCCSGEEAEADPVRSS
jgi:hypothetical protein